MDPVNQMWRDSYADLPVVVQHPGKVLFGK
jgi:hypothetical protein